MAAHHHDLFQGVTLVEIVWMMGLGNNGKRCPQQEHPKDDDWTFGHRKQFFTAVLFFQEPLDFLFQFGWCNHRLEAKDGLSVFGN